MMLSSLRLLVSISFIVLATEFAFSQYYPAKPIRIYTSTPGGGADALARVIAGGITGPLGQPVIVENRGGSVPEVTVSKATPDGYSLLLTGSGFALTPLLEPTEYGTLEN